LPGIQIGQLLVQQGVLTEKQVQHILTVQRSSHRPFGDLAERLYGVSPEASRTRGCISMCRWRRGRSGRAGGRQAVSAGDQSAAGVAVSDPADASRRSAFEHRDRCEHLIRAVNFSTRRIDEPVYFVIAKRQQLREFLMKHYPCPSIWRPRPEYVGQDNKSKNPKGASPPLHSRGEAPASFFGKCIFTAEARRRREFKFLLCCSGASAPLRCNSNPTG